MSTTHAPSSEAPNRRRRWPWFVGAVIALTVSAVLTVMGCTSSGEPQTQDRDRIHSDAAPLFDNPEPWTPTPPPAPSDFSIDLKTVSKQCFGSAGCNLVVEPRLSYVGSAEQFSAYGICDVTYEITGDESGEVIETAYGQSSTEFSANQTIMQTESNAVVPSATVIEVSCS